MASLPKLAQGSHLLPPLGHLENLNLNLLDIRNTKTHEKRNKPLNINKQICIYIYIYKCVYTRITLHPRHSRPKAPKLACDHRGDLAVDVEEHDLMGSGFRV